MIDRLNKTSICSIVFLDIIDYSKKSVSEQIDEKAFFNELINEAIKSVAQNDRIILDTGDGAAIALMGEPEEALFISLTIRDGILHQNKSTGQPLRVRIGINLGSVRVVNDINDRPNIIGDGINVAQRIMSFAGENEILVSRSYYEVTSRLTKEMSGMFTYSGVKQDKHIREHEVYLIKPKESDEIKVAESGFADSKNERAPINLPSNMLKGSSRMLLVVVGLLAGLIALYFFSIQSKPTAAIEPVATEIIAKDKAAVDSVDKGNNKTQTATYATKLRVTDDKKQSADAAHKKKLAKKSSSNHQQYSAKAEMMPTVSTKTTQSIKKPVEKSCSQAEIAMNQCR